MSCRRIVDGNVVWFGSVGTDVNGKALFISSDKHDNYSTEAESVKDSLTQRLSVIRGELWNDIYTGLPLLEKTKSTSSMDSAIAEIILKHPNVYSILTFTSKMEKTSYHCSVTVQTTYGIVEVVL